MSDMADVKELRKDVKALRSQGHDSAANGVECIANRIEELEARLEIHDEIIAEKLEQIYRQSKRIEELEEKNAKLTRLVTTCDQCYVAGHTDSSGWYEGPNQTVLCESCFRKQETNQ